MTITTTTRTFKDGDQQDFDGKMLHDSITATDNPCHAVLDGATGDPISPATAGKQDTANAALAAIRDSTGAGVVSLATPVAVQEAAYTSGMVVGGKIGLAGAARMAGGSGSIQNAFVAKAGSYPALFDLFVFHTDPVNSTFGDRQALNIAPADLDKLADVIHCDDLVDCVSAKLARMAQGPVVFDLPAGSTTLYVVPVIRGSETYASTSVVTVGIGIAQF